MKKLFALVFLISFIGLAQDASTNLKEYSYSEFFELIAKETDSIFEFQDAVIRYSQETDTLFTGTLDSLSGYVVSDRKQKLIVNKEMSLKNVHFITDRSADRKNRYGIIGNIWFKKKVTIISAQSAEFYDCIFDQRLISRSGEDIARQFPVEEVRTNDVGFMLKGCTLKKGGQIRYMLMEHEDVANMNLSLSNCEIYISNDSQNRSDYDFLIFGRNLVGMYLNDNRFYGDGQIHFRAIEIMFQNISYNKFNNIFTDIYVSDGISFNQFALEDNVFKKATFLDIDDIGRQYSIPIDQFEGGLYARKAYTRFLRENLPDYQNTSSINDSIIAQFRASMAQSEKVFDEELSFKAQLHSYYKSKFNNKAANKVYVQTKNLETERSKYLYKENKNFNSFFTWKINQFLRVFSAYGTQPARAIVFSMYVILFFALIYLFFPNSWDKHGKNRIVERYNFFFKYMQRRAGIHEVYLEDQKEELMSYDQFKANISNSEQKVPKFFSVTALPLYKWAISGTRLSASILKRIDIMKGTWTELPKAKRIWKSILLIGAFLIAITYDIFIKMLNALMLSINTFTTLGFGEIPIKGLPRYLAIIQGFIGWFMLTIFSVSLISQLLN